MSKQPEALRLADALNCAYTVDTTQEAAAELRRLHAENEALKSELRMEQTISFRVQMQQYAAQRDALLEALKFVLSATGEQLTTAFEQAEFAIAKAEGGDA